VSRDVVITGDALFTQHKLSAQIPQQGGQYVGTVKKNQHQLDADSTITFAPLRAEERAVNYNYRTAATLGEGQDRVEERTIRVTGSATGLCLAVGQSPPYYWPGQLDWCPTLQQPYTRWSIPGIN
jgi:hypothetical protein